MSVSLWILSALAAYVGYIFYQKVEYGRKRAEYILDRRRAAGIPDNDKRPFASARADALTRIAEQKQLELVKTPTRSRKLVETTSRQPPDAGIASRLSGIPGALPGYLKHTTSQKHLSTKLTRSPASSSTMQSVRQRASPSPIKHSMKAERSSAKKALKRELAQVDTDDEDDEHAPNSPTRQRALKRRHELSPSRNSPLQEASMSETSQQKVAIPGQFDSDLDEAMVESDDRISHDEGESEQSLADVTMSEDSDQEMIDVSPERVSDGLVSLKKSARVTAKKRDMDDARSSQSRSPSADLQISPQSHRKHQPKRSKASGPNVEQLASVSDGTTLQFKPLPDPLSRPVAGSKRALDTSEDRKPGDEWVDYEGLRWRIDASTHELQRLSDVIEWRSKYKMPKDSMHPMAKERHQVIVSKWLTKDEWEEAKAQNLLGYQEAERLHEKERQEKEAQERLRRKQEILAKIRETSSPNKRLNLYLASKQRGSNSLLSADSSMTDDGDRSVASVMSIDSADGGKPRSRRISLTAANSPKGRTSPSTATYRSLRYPTPSKSASASPLTKTTFAQSPQY